MANLVSASPDFSPVSLPPTALSPTAKVAPTSSSSNKTDKARPKSSVQEAWVPTAVMLGHWHKRTWDLAHQLNVDARCHCVAAVTDLRDALVVLNAAIPPVELLVCSSYDLEDVQEMLQDYEGDMKVLIAPQNLMNTGGAVSVANWAGNMIDARSFHPKTGTLSPGGFYRRLSATSSGSGSGI
ncbi:hypothetical protein JCM8097_005002 [Rhodosporidiobolus ruineniae]